MSIQNQQSKMNSTTKLGALLLVAALVPWAQCSIQLEQQQDDDNYALSDEFIAKINSMQSSWKAGRNFDPKVTPLKNVRSLCGAIDNPEMDKLFVSRTMDEPLLRDVTIPTEFDARKAWPNCTSIRLIRDQGTCGSCWAIGTVSAISDRICIASGEKVNVQISGDDLMSCCTKCGRGCNGGDHAVGWHFYSQNGLSSGGEYNSKVGCKPYSIPHCDHHVNGTYPPCGKSFLPTPECTSKCTNPSYTKLYQQDKFYGNSVVSWLRTQEQVKLDILKHGSVSTRFDVYEDFLSYKSGVYVKTLGKYNGGHAVRMIGWGEENGTPYWLLTNSWNEHWGDHGIFKIRRGTDECGIESRIFSGIPKL